jgi:hypothetical protein
MFFFDNPLTKSLTQRWRSKIQDEFPFIEFAENTEYLSLKNYVFDSPQRFYSTEALSYASSFLEDLIKADPGWLSKVLNEEEHALNVANRVLDEINQKPIHEKIINDAANQTINLINFIDQEIHYDLLRLYETPFYCFIYILAKRSRIERGKKTDGLDLYNAVEELKDSYNGIFSKIYNNGIRNGIAHGKVVYADDEIQYFDKNKNITKSNVRAILQMFDNALDLTNGLCLAYKIFYLTKKQFLDVFKIKTPLSILLEELKLKVDSKEWRTVSYLESVALQNKKQLNIYINNFFWDFNKVQFSCFYTAIWAESLTKIYDRIFISLNSKNAKIGPSGWASFDAQMLRKNREDNRISPENYSKVLEGNIIFFQPKMKFPRILYKIGSFISIIGSSLPLSIEDFKNRVMPQKHLIRDTRIHSKGKFLVISDTSVVIKKEYKNNAGHIVVNEYKNLIKNAIKYSRKKYNIFNIKRYLPVKYIRVFVFDTDKRLRQLRYSGLPKELVATIEVNTSKKIQTIDIITGVPEVKGKYRIVWNKRWNNYEQKNTFSK